MGSASPETMKFEADGMTIADFSSMISTLVLQQPVIDKTGLTGLFDFRLEFSMAPGKEPVEFLLIDRVERPSGN